MRKTEFHYPDKGVNASWGCACGHLSNPIWYESTEKAEEQRQARESSPCWDCQQKAAAARPVPEAVATTG